MIEKIDTAGWYKMTFQGMGFNVTDVSAEMLVQAVRLCDKKKGQVDLKDLANLKFEVNGLFGLDEKGELIV